MGQAASDDQPEERDRQGYQSLDRHGSFDSAPGSSSRDPPDIARTRSLPGSWGSAVGTRGLSPPRSGRTSMSPLRTASHGVARAGSLRQAPAQPSVHRALSEADRSKTIDTGVQSLEALQRAVAEAKEALEVVRAERQEADGEDNVIVPTEGIVGSIYNQANDGHAQSQYHQPNLKNAGSKRLNDITSQAHPQTLRAKEAVQACREAVAQCKAVAKVAREVEVAEMAAMRCIGQGSSLTLNKSIGVPTTQEAANPPVGHGTLCGTVFGSGCDWCSREGHVPNRRVVNIAGERGRSPCCPVDATSVKGLVLLRPEKSVL